VVRYADVEKDPGLKFVTGSLVHRRIEHAGSAKNVEVDALLPDLRIPIRPTDESASATNTPNARKKYVYVTCPKRLTGIQLVYNTHESPELVPVVRDGDAVLMPSGYQPNVSVPGTDRRFYGDGSASRGGDRQFGS